MRLRMALCAFLVSLAVLAPARAETIRPGVLVVGSVATFPPLAFTDTATGRVMGADIDLARLIAAELGLRLEIAELSFAQLLPALQTRRIDMAMAGMGDRPSRRETVNFINYLRSGAQFYALAPRAAQYRSDADVCGKRVGGSRGAQWVDRAAEWNAENCVAKGRPPIVFVGTESTADTRTQLLSGRLDLGITGSEAVGYLLSQDPGRFVRIGPSFSGYLVGIPFLKNNPAQDALLERVKAALTRIQERGDYDAVLARYGIGENAYKPLTINQGN